MDIKKFGHIFYTLTYLPIKKIWTNLEKSWYFYKTFRLFENWVESHVKCEGVSTYKINIYWPIYSISHNKLCTFIRNCRFLEFWNILSWYLIKGSHKKLIFSKVKTLVSKQQFWTEKPPKLFEKKYGPSCLTYLPSKKLSKFFF